MLIIALMATTAFAIPHGRDRFRYSGVTKFWQSFGHGVTGRAVGGVQIAVDPDFGARHIGNTQQFNGNENCPIAPNWGCSKPTFDVPPGDSIFTLVYTFTTGPPTSTACTTQWGSVDSNALFDNLGNVVVVAALSAEWGNEQTYLTCEVFHGVDSVLVEGTFSGDTNLAAVNNKNGFKILDPSKSWFVIDGNTGLGSETFTSIANSIGLGTPSFPVGAGFFLDTAANGQWPRVFD